MLYDAASSTTEAHIYFNVSLLALQECIGLVAPGKKSEKPVQKKIKTTHKVNEDWHTINQLN